MRILVTGGAGFIGSNFVTMMVERYPEDDVVVLDKLTYAGRLENLAHIRDRITFVHGDICDPGDIGRAGDCDCIINFAAETHVDRSIQDAGLFVKTDVLGTHMLLEYALRHGVERYVQISTDEVYGSIREGSFREGDPLNPSSPYSASKAGAEMLVQAYHTTYGLPVVTTRSSNNFGPFQFPEKLIPVLILNAVRDAPLPIYGDGKNVRDWIYVLDNCEAIDLAMRKGKSGEIYNVGAGNEWPNIDIARYILQYLDKPESLIRFVGDRKGHDFRYSVITEKIRALGWRPAHTFEEGMQKTIEWYRRSPWWWKPLL